MKIFKYIAATGLSITLSLSLVSPSFAANDDKKEFSVNIDLVQINEDIKDIKDKIKNTKDNEKLIVLKDMLKSLEKEKRKVKQDQSSTGEFSTASANVSKWFAGEGDEVFHSNTSSHDSNHKANIKVKIRDVTWSGFDWSGTSGSYWLASSPYNVYKIKNSMTFTAHGVNLSGSLNGLSVSGAVSGSATISSSKSNNWTAGNTFDAFSSGSTIKAVFASGSQMTKYSYSTPDSTLAQITFYDPSF
ncbi:hypothetical protein FZC78_06470 [Rossellomorea vietnamensis]|uniref:Uncharacterized protein n=1 Tax=Rossellomorea vietnamensis TaxID=218284 RepID=A0A5D4NVP6_9BACI|nr:hypothetical protein [Rossellomorea vietnamensis]TYS17518.1 hypothetical protein FZC78_06470 [Rossellomorea vietnamensis]